MLFSLQIKSLSFYEQKKAPIIHFFSGGTLPLIRPPSLWRLIYHQVIAAFSSFTTPKPNPWPKHQKQWHSAVQ